MSVSERLALRFAVFAAGALLMGLEVAAFRIIGKTFGSALRETTAVIAVFLAAMSVGYWAGGRVGDRWPRATTLVATLVAAASSLMFVPAIDAMLSPRIAGSSFALATHAFLATTILFAIPSLLLAATSPIAIRLFATTTGESGSTAGSISALSTAGSIAGSIVTAFLLIDWLASIARTVTVVAIATLATALIVLLAQRVRPRYAFAAAGGLVAILAAGVFVRTRVDAAGPKPVFVGDSAYHHILVTDHGPMRDLRFNVGVQSTMRRSDPFGPGLMYTDSFHIGRLLRPNAKRILVIGLGGGTAARQFPHYYPEVEVDVVDVDPVVVDVAQRYFGVKPSARLRLHTGDGRTFLKRATQKWDLIVLDAYSTNRYGDTLPPHLVTREFFRDVSARLSEDGVVHYHCAFGNSRLLGALHATMGSVFSNVLRTRGELLASHLPMIATKDVLRARAKGSQARRLPELPRLIEELSDAPPPRDAMVLTDDYAPVDTLLGRR
ncbi:MAG TPA: fused MFS/spermidine synthase [Thermoanaerobaculia bacterium]|nr:fused MFS/spermidine synthase [Thermoanaerobaculia bacterium]